MKIINALLISVFSLFVVACTLDSPAERSTQTAPLIESSDPDEQPSAIEPTLVERDAGQGDGNLETAANCSIVQYCDMSDSEGTRCIQQGCSFAAAKTECINEGWNVCGTPKCPWKIKDLSGKLHELCI